MTRQLADRLIVVYYLASPAPVNPSPHSRRQPEGVVTRFLLPPLPARAHADRCADLILRPRPVILRCTGESAEASRNADAVLATTPWKGRGSCRRAMTQSCP